MTVSSELSRVAYATDGITDTFIVPFRFLAASHLQVAHWQNDVTHSLTSGTHYSVTGANDPAGGAVTLATVPVAGGQIIITRTVPITQETAYPKNDPFPEAAHERALDKLTMIAQQLADGVSRTIKVPASLSLTGEAFVDVLFQVQSEAAASAANAENSANAAHLNEQAAAASAAAAQASAAAAAASGINANTPLASFPGQLPYHRIDGALNVATLATLPATDIGPVIVADVGEIWLWVQTAHYTGYRSPLCGRPVDGHTALPLASEIDAVGGLLSKTDYAGLWGYAQENSLVVTQTQWSANLGAHWFVDVSASQFRVPDLRNQFRRYTGTDADSGYARALGSYKADTIKSHRHATGLGYVSNNSSGPMHDTRPNQSGTAYTQAFGTAETAPKHVAFHPRIHV